MEIQLSFTEHNWWANNVWNMKHLTNLKYSINDPEQQFFEQPKIYMENLSSCLLPDMETWKKCKPNNQNYNVQDLIILNFIPGKNSRYFKKYT